MLLHFCTPILKRFTTSDMFRNFLIIELIERLLINQQIAATQLVFDALNTSNLVHVMLQKWRIATKVTSH